MMKNNNRRIPQRRKSGSNRLRERWDATLSGMIEISRMLSYNLDVESIWDTLHDHVNLTFDSTSFFVALYNYERDRLILPLVSEDGLRVHYEPIPVCGLSRAIMTHGVEFYLQDIEAEGERLAALNAEPDEREPGRWARSWMGVPLRSRQSEVTGLIALQNTLPNSFDDHDLSLLMAIAAPLSLALENVRLVEAERERRLIAGAIMEIGQLAGANLDYEDVLERILDQLQRVVAYDSAAILLTLPDADRRLIVGATHNPDVFDKGAELRAAEASPLTQSILSQQPVVVDPAQRFETWWESDLGDLPPSCDWMIVPVVVQQRVSALILLGKIGGYTQKDASSGFALARQGAIALETVRLQAQAQSNLQMLQQRARRLASINRITSVITSSLDRDDVFRATAQLLTELFEVDHCGIIMREALAVDAVLVAEYPDTGSIGMRIPLAGNATMEWLDRYATVVTIEDVGDISVDNATREALQKIGAQSTLIAPLIARDRVIGTIGIDMISHQRSFTAEERETLVTIAGQVGMAVSHANLYEEALAANRLKSAFLANIGHELRTPLNAIIGYSEMLLSEFYGTLNEQQRDRLSRVNTSGQHLLSMIDDVLELSKIEAGQITLAPETLRLSDALNKVVEKLTPEAQAKNLTLTASVSPPEPSIRADRAALLQIVENLVKNAIRFTPSGSVAVEVLPVTVGASEPPAVALPERLYPLSGDWLALRVRDTGIGIKPEDQAIIFESFRQVDNSSAREYDGPGLGLAITQRLVNLHEGYIWVESALGTGSVFTVLLPALSQGEEPGAAT